MRYHKIKFLRLVQISISIAFTLPIHGALADPTSDFFAPDFFRTERSLQRRVPTLRDPLSESCALPSEGLTLAGAVDIALCRNPATRVAWGAAKQQAAAVGEAESAYLPSINGTASEYRTFGGTHVDPTGDLIGTPQNTRDAAVNLTWTLYDFGGREARVRSARYLLDSAAATLNRTVQQTVLNVTQAYYGVVAGDATFQASRVTEQTATHSLDVARSLQGAGVATLADVLQAQTALDQAVLTRIQSNASAESAAGTLSVTLGLPADQHIKIAPEVVPTESPAFSARMTDLMSEAMRQRPDLAAARAQADSAEADISTARSVGRPSISFQAGRSIADTTGIPNQSFGQVGVYLTVPIFSGFGVGYGVRQAQAVFLQRVASEEQTRLTVTQDVWNAYYALGSATEQLGATAALVKTASDNQDVALGRYQSGVGTIIDVLTAQTAASQARLQRINTELSWEVARAQMALALGRLTSADPLVP